MATPTTATDHVRAAQRVLAQQGREDESVAHSRIALALAVMDLAAAAKADAQPPVTQQPWPANVTARILTRIGTRARHFHEATVDIIDDHDTSSTHGITTALCRPCGWTRDNSAIYRDKVLELARDHADQCTALPNPTA